MPELKSNLPVTSREYKLLLKKANFENRNGGSETFWSIVEDIAGSLGGRCQHTPQDIKRVTWFLDTPDDLLLQRGYILRVREEAEEDKRFKITMKFRHSDRYIASSVRLDSAEKVKSKFEEDILHPFTCKFSQSVTFRKREHPHIQKVADILNIFPEIDISGIHTGFPVVVRSDFKAYELTHRLGTITFGSGLTIKCCLNFWYRAADYSGTPVVAEFSFDYDADLNGEIVEHYPEETVRKSYHVFTELQKKTDWFDSDSKTKTAMIAELKET